MAPPISYWSAPWRTFALHRKRKTHSTHVLITLKTNWAILKGISSAWCATCIKSPAESRRTSKVYWNQFTDTNEIFKSRNKSVKAIIAHSNLWHGLAFDCNQIALIVRGQIPLIHTLEFQFHSAMVASNDEFCCLLKTSVNKFCHVFCNQFLRDTPYSGMFPWILESWFISEATHS